jgi:hypothetical protein
MAEPKTKKTTASVAAFLNAIPDPDRRADSKTVAKLLEKVTKAKPKMWGPSIIGFGDHSYIGSNGKSVAWMQVGMSPRKAALTVYGVSAMRFNAALAAKLGKYTTGKGCLYIKRLSDIDLAVLERIVRESIALLKAPKS